MEVGRVADEKCLNCGTGLPQGAEYCPRCGGPAYPVAYAGFWRRFVAFVVDSIILGIPVSIILTAVLFAALPESIHTAASATVRFLVSVVFSWLYYTLLESSRAQATPGKMLLGIVVIDLPGQRISWARANARYWSKYISAIIFYIGYIMAGFTSKKQALHDMIAGTLVIKKHQEL
jgi:uncharacterized RDD family membrane protein YckC